MKKNNQIKPTESELEILQILWKKGDVTVREVNNVLNEFKEVGYTTTLKLMQIMHDKSILSRDTSQRTHVYTAIVKEKDIQSSLLKSFVDKAFSGSAMNLVMQTLGNHNASKEELAEIKALIQKLENDKK